MVVFDVEGVLVNGEVLPERAGLVGKKDEAEDITIKGEISWKGGLAKRVDLVKKEDRGRNRAPDRGLP